jgi:hypothetical protein
MSLTLLETVETELKRTRFVQKKGSKTDGLEKTVTWTPRTLKTELGRKRYGKNKIQGLNCEYLEV